MSADFRTEHYRGYAHPGGIRGDSSGTQYIHVVEVDGRQEIGPLGSFTLAEITELAQMAGQAWPKGSGVEVRYVIEARRPGKDWTVMWSALADEDSEAGVSEDYAQVAFDGMRHASLEFRLVRRTVLAADEVLSPDGAGE